MDVRLYYTFSCDTTNFLAAAAKPFHEEGQPLYRYYRQFQPMLLASIIPAPVMSRNSFTKAAVIAIILFLLVLIKVRI